MINRINPTSILPFYTNLNQQSSKYYWNAGYVVQADNRYLIPFQFRLSGTANLVSSFELISIDGNSDIVLNSGLVTITQDGGFSYISYNGLDTGSTHDCGEYYVKLTVDSVQYYSDIIRLNVWENTVDYERWWKLSYRPSFTTHHDMYFSTAFTPAVYIEAWLDYPEIEREETIDVDTTGLQVLTSAYTKERQVLVTNALPNQLRYPLSLIRELSTGLATLVSLKNTDLEFQITEPVFNFANAGNEYWTEARLLFTAQRDFVNACGVDESGYVAFGEIEDGDIAFGEVVDGDSVFGYLN